jgi:alkylation response protein AidB-like acyl-CoA dehydrogenase
MDFEPSRKSQDYVNRVRSFIDEHIAPIEDDYWRGVAEARNGGLWRQYRIDPRIGKLKALAREQGLWNLFLDDETLGAGLTTLEYAPVAEQTGRSLMAPEIFNCSAPDTGNMEVLYKYGSPAQKERWLKPLLAGEIRSAFCMTEPDVASSDATNMQATAVVKGGEVVLNGRKWWSTGAGDPRCKIAIFMARTPDPAQDRHHQHSMVLVPLDAAGVEIRRMLPVFGEYHEPTGHAEIWFKDVRVPVSNIIAGPGRGFEIAQGRLGPGRIHHCMRCLGSAERALELMIDRGMSRTAFGQPLLKLDGNRQRVAEARIAIDQARLMTLYAAWKIDKVGVHGAMTEIAAIKVIAPNVLQKICDDAIQIHGGAGVTNDVPLTALFAEGRMLRLADGPDEVHKAMIARIELKRRGFGKQASAE